MLSPLPRRSGWAYCFAHSPIRVSLPRYGRRVGLRIVLFEACSAFTRVTACTLALSPIRDTLTEGFSHFVTSMTAPVASGWSDLPGGIYTHWKAPPFHGARQERTHAVCRACDHRCRTVAVHPPVSTGRFELSDKDEAALGGLLKTKASHWSP